MKAVGAERISSSLMLEEASRGDCLEEGVDPYTVEWR